MRIQLPDGAYVNVAHISLMSGIQTDPADARKRLIKLLLMGAREHVVTGTDEEIKAVYAKLKNALAQLDG